MLLVEQEHKVLKFEETTKIIFWMLPSHYAKNFGVKAERNSLPPPIEKNAYGGKGGTMKRDNKDPYRDYTLTSKEIYLSVCSEK